MMKLKLLINFFLFNIQRSFLHSVWKICRSPFFELFMLSIANWMILQMTQIAANMLETPNQSENETLTLLVKSIWY